MSQNGIWRDRFTGDGGLELVRRTGRKSQAHTARPDWAAESTDLWSGLLRELEVAEPGEYEEDDEDAAQLTA